MHESQIMQGDRHSAKIRTGAAMLLRIWRFIGTYLTAPTLSLVLCGLLAGCTVQQLCAKVTAAVSIKRSEHLTVDGTKLYLLTRGADRSAPVFGPPPYNNVGQVLAMEKLVQRYGGVFHKEPCRSWIMVRAIFSALVTPREIPRLIHANNVSLEAMNEELVGLDLARSVPRTDVPVLFCLGRYDRHTEAKLAATYFASLRAPGKRLVWFEKSAHNIPFEEPRLFNATVVRELQSIGIGLAADEGVQRK